MKVVYKLIKEQFFNSYISKEINEKIGEMTQLQLL